MSKLIKEIEFSLNEKMITIEELNILEERLREEYNNITEEYRTLFHKIKGETKKKKREIIMKCDHNYIRYSEYHNERYFVCDKCGNEKY